MSTNGIFPRASAGLDAPASTPAASAKFSKLTWHKKLNGEKRLNGTEYRVLMVFFDHSREDGTRAFPSLEDVQGEACVSESTAKRAVRKLIELGWLVLDRRGGKRNGRKFANVYRLAVPATWEPYVPAKRRKAATIDADRPADESRDKSVPENRVMGDPGTEEQGHPWPPNRSSNTSDPCKDSGRLRRPSGIEASDSEVFYPPLSEWKVKNRHWKRAEDLGLDIALVEQRFREQMYFESRTCWDSTFWEYLDATDRDREGEEFPWGVRE